MSHWCIEPLSRYHPNQLIVRTRRDVPLFGKGREGKRRVEEEVLLIRWKINEWSAQHNTGAIGQQTAYSVLKVLHTVNTTRTPLHTAPPV